MYILFVLYVFLKCYYVFSLETVSKSCAVLSLNGTWTVTNSNNSININANVPGSIYTDLMKAGVIGDPYYRNNDVQYKWIGRENWTFNKSFIVECEILQKNRVLLIFHGLDTVSKIWLNSEYIGSSDNMFVRYAFDVKDILQANNTLTIAFKSAVIYAMEKHEEQLKQYVIPPTCPPPIQNGECHFNYIRKSAASFSWDWGPAFPTQGLWKTVEIVGFNNVIINDIVVFTEKLLDSSWKMAIHVFLETASTAERQLQYEIYLDDYLLKNTTILCKPENLAMNITSTINIPKEILIQEWWPNGLGNQTLYNLKVIVPSDNEISVKNVRIGFRTLELVEEPVENSTGLSFYFRVNGVPFFAKGSNWIPPDSFPERVTPKYIRSLLQSAKDANMNMMRVWGGGVYESDIFYDIADEMGIFIWQDLMFACALYPAKPEFLKSISIEVQQQVRRFQHHASLLLWAGNNENEQALVNAWWPAILSRFSTYKNDYLKLYVDTIMPIIKLEDPSRPFLTSSPSNGKHTEEEGWVSNNPQDYQYGDVHFYSYTGNTWDWKKYPRARFVSEYGFQSYPSLDSITSVSNASVDWTYPVSSFLHHRQHHTFGDFQINSMITNHLYLPSRNCNTTAFKDLLYMSQIVQAMSIKVETELYRRSMSEVVDGYGKTMGALYWQLNDIWQGASWASIEYGGKWKMLHYYAKKFFAPFFISPFIDGNQVKVYAVSDLTEPQQNCVLRIYIYKWSSFIPVYTETILFNQPPLTAQQVYIRNLNGSNSLLDEALCSSQEECFMYFTLNEPQNLAEVSNNFLLLSELNKLYDWGQPLVKVINVSEPFETLFSKHTFEITLKTTQIAIFVWLEAFHLHGRFSDNGFLMTTESLSVMFYSADAIDVYTLLKTLSVRSLTDTCRLNA